MKLSECNYGVLVLSNDKKLGHIVGLTYDINISICEPKSNSELIGRTIPLVKFVGEDVPRGINNWNLSIFKD